MKMSGWKTWVAGGISILSGLILIGKTLIGEPGPEGGFVEGIALIVAGLGLIGIGHKVEKAGPTQ